MSTTNFSEISRQIEHGYGLLRAGKHMQALESVALLAAKFPGHARIYVFAAEVNRVVGDMLESLRWIEKAVAISDNPQYMVKMAWLLSRLRRRDEIPALARQIALHAEEDPDDGTLFWQLGKLYYHHNLLADAVTHYIRAIGFSDRPDWRYDLATARFYSGDPGAAEKDLERVLLFSPQAGQAIYLRSVLRKQRPEDNHVEDIETRLLKGFRQPEDEAASLYALAKELEDLGEYQRSFVALQRGARKKREAIQYDVKAVVATLSEIMNGTNSEALSGSSTGHGGEGAIFIVGMPRTGTTLAERVLVQSGKVKNAGELMDFSFLLTSSMQRIREEKPSLLPTAAALQVDFAALGERYMSGARQLAGGSNYFIDKMPANYMYCGMIRRALPNAKIIHLVRDPMDSCYAIFKTLFFNAYDFSYELDELAEYYIAYFRMMQHWRDVMPGAILDVRYEDLVMDTEAQAKCLYAWCGLEWTPDALNIPGQGTVFATASAAQVREAVHTRSINSWRRHGEALESLHRKLVAAGVI